ncbi:MAG: pilus assembly protein [Acidimicrobiia bacterium]|nr:pilus assembly protein [Acidimicrobiia bacterium]
MSNDRGTSTLELAFVAPLLFVLALGIVDMGRALALSVTVSEAAQEGVIFAGHDPSDPDAIVSRVIFSATDPKLEPDQVTVTCLTAPSDHVSVTVDYQLDLMTPLIADLVGGTVDLSKTVTGEIFSEDPCVGS